jgi:phospholipid/cholesterol/gamma-HCH transport system ATP-binding protein
MTDTLTPPLQVRALSIGYGTHLVQQELSFDVSVGSIFAIMGVSGCGKSTLLHSLMGLLRPSAGTVCFQGNDYWSADDTKRAEIGRRFGVLFQTSALWSSLTASENVALPLQMFTKLGAASIEALVQMKLALVGLESGRTSKPADLSGGMAKRVGLARAIALDPDILFLDEPSAGLDPISAKRLDDLILELRDGFGVTVVMVSHELPSLMTICDDGIFLDEVTHTMIAHGAPKYLRANCTDPTVSSFMNRTAPTSKGDTSGGIDASP